MCKYLQEQFFKYKFLRKKHMFKIYAYVTILIQNIY